MRPAFIVTVHQSEQYRPNGHAFLNEYIKTLNDNLNIEYDLFIMENASDEYYEFPKSSHYRYFPDQTQGMTRCWNEGVKMAIENGNDIICVTNEDLIFNSTINDFFDAINSHEHKDISVYGPICNHARTFPPQKQIRTENKIVDITGNQYPVHGWFMTFTDKYYQKFNNNGLIFDKELKWRCQEKFQEINWKIGAKSFVVHSCLIHHEHIGSWRETEKYIK